MNQGLVGTIRREMTTRFDANLSILFPDLPLLKRPAAAAALGFDAVELWWPFETETPSPPDVDRLVDAIGEAGVSLVLLNLSPGRRTRGEHGLVAIPAEEARFRNSLEVAVSIAGRIGCVAINALYGAPSGDTPAELVDATAIANLAFAAKRAAAVGSTIVVEALNSTDFPHYGLRRTADSLALAERVQARTGERIAILFDVYHAQRSEGDLIARIEAHSSLFGHVQIADAPGRFHPGTGEIAFERVLQALERTGYGGYVGLEYSPSLDPAETFAWLPVERRRSRTALAGQLDGHLQ